MEAIGVHATLNMALLFLLVMTALSVVLVRNLLVATVLLTIYSLLMAAMYLILGAPDVAITEASIGAGISTILLLSVLLLTGEKEKQVEHPIVPLLVIGITSVALIYAVVALPDFGDPNAVANTHLAPYFLEASWDDIGIPNVVTSVLASYRGFDTMGEVFVIFTAAMSVLLILGDRRPKRKSAP